MDNLTLFHTLAKKWKKKHPLIGQSIFTAKELAALKTVVCFPSFLDRLIKTPSLQELFFQWILQDGNDPLCFIQFPDICQKMIEANLSCRIGIHGSRVLKIEKNDLLLLFEGKYLSILNLDNQVTFRGNYTLTIEEIFDVFAKKDVDVGNLEFMQEGIINWNIHKLGYWHADLEQYIPIDLDSDRWWEQMPLYLTLTKKQTMKRYGLSLNSKNWVASAVATRLRPNLDFESTHAFLEIAIPLPNGHFAIYDFGKLATKYPASNLERVMMLTKTVLSTVAFPDDNVFYTNRQFGYYPFTLTPRQGKNLMQLIRKDIETARSQGLVYQIESENCAKWVYYKLDAILKYVPDFFQMQLLDTEPNGIVSYIFAYIKKLPENWQVPVLTFLHLPLGAARKVWVLENGEKTPKSLFLHPFFTTGQIFLPALLVHKIMKFSFELPIPLFCKFKLRFYKNIIAFKGFRYLEIPPPELN